jgi:hypothetical protein
MAYKVFGVDSSEEDEMKNGYFGGPYVERRIR